MEIIEYEYNNAKEFEKHKKTLAKDNYQLLEMYEEKGKIIIKYRKYF